MNEGVSRSLSQPMIRKSAAENHFNPLDQPRTAIDDSNSNRQSKKANEDIALAFVKEDHQIQSIAATTKSALASVEEDHKGQTITATKENALASVKEVQSITATKESALASVEEVHQVQTITTTTKSKPNKAKPHLFLHVGPQKTGSSTLQSTLDKLTDLTDKCEDDNLYLRHISPERGDFDCELDQWGAWLNCKASNSLKALIQKARDEGKNLLLTDENLGENFVHGLRDAIDEKDWDVTVIVMYRRIHEWLVSWYNQINKTTNRDSEGNVLFNEDGVPYRTKHIDWPAKGGAHISGFRPWYEQWIRYWEPSNLANMHRSIEYYNLYNESFDNVLLYNMHKEGNMVTDFICNIVGAVHACDRLKSQTIKIEKENGSVHLDHDIIAVYAYEQGLVSKSLSRTEVAEAVTAYVLESGKTVPRTCNLEMTNQIRDWLVDTEKIMVGVGKQNWSDAKEKELLELYNSFVANGKMCDVDTEAILLDEEWLRFFRSLGGIYEKRDIVLHVGPIGGNAIRNALEVMSGEGQALQKDNYTMIDFDIHDGDKFDCTETNCRGTPQLKSLFSSLEETGMNILVSSDYLDERFVEAFKEAIDENKWNVKVIVGYIRINQLLLMMYQREYSHENIDPNGHFLIRPKEIPNNKAEVHSKWPDQGGTLIPSFNAWFSAFSENSDIQQIKQLVMHHRDAYASAFGDVDFLAYHQRKDLVTNFVCHIPPRATQTCKAAKADKAKDSHQEFLLDDYAEADILAVRAYEKGLVEKGVSRATLRDAIQAKLRSTKKVLSRVCVSDVTKQLYDWMIESEKAMIGDKFTSKRIAWINQDFQHMLESGKLCALDVEQELRNELWVGFFHQIGQDRH